MNKRITRAGLAAAFVVAGLVILLAGAAVAGAAPATAAASASPAGATAALGETAPVYGWVLQLRGAISENLTYQQFAAMEAKDPGTPWTDTSTPANTFNGIPLWRLVGLVDDKNPKTFNDALATQGYTVQIVGIDGFVGTLTSNDVTKPWVGDDTVIVADQENAATLAFGFMKTKNAVTSWHPTWPLQLCATALPGSVKPSGIETIIVYAPGATVPSPPTTLPSWIAQVRGVTSVDYTAAQFRKLAAAHPAAWTDDNGTAGDPSDDHVYAGTPLWRLVALADGGSPATLNLDRIGLGYKVDVTGMGATAPAVASFDAGAIVNKSVVVANNEDGSQLTPTQGNCVLQPDGVTYAWVPTWPARLVGTGVTADQSIGGVVRVTLEKPVVPSYVTPLVLKGRHTARISYLNFPTPATWDGTKAGNINPTVRALYRGQSLYKLVGLVDDKHPGSFNKALARKGYKIKLIASDGYTWTISSKTIVGKKGWIVASLKDGKTMDSTEGPYRFVGSFIKPFYGKESVSKLVTIKLIF
jgi:hypothetical protein